MESRAFAVNAVPARLVTATRHATICQLLRKRLTFRSLDPVVARVHDGTGVRVHVEATNPDLSNCR